MSAELELENGLTAEEQEAQLYEEVTNAILGTGLLNLKATIGQGEESKTVELKVRWPDLEDEEAMERRAAEILQYPAENMPGTAVRIARARAMIEQLAVAPYPQFLFSTLAGQMPTEHKGKKEIRPNTGKLQSRAVVGVLYDEYIAKYARFQYLAL